MARPFDVLNRAAFARIEFQCDHIAIKGGLRDHVHEYPHSPGGQPEKLGRKLYTFSMDGVFTTDQPLYPGAWPDNINSLRGMFEQEITDDLVIPTIGTIKAYAFNWDQENTSKMLNGERMRIEFREDSVTDQLTDTVLAFQYQSITTKAQALIEESIKAGFTPDFFQSIADFANEIQGEVDQVNLQADLISTKCDQLAEACRTLDNIVVELNKPPAYKVVEALHDLTVAADNLSRDALSKLSPTVLFTVPAQMTISMVATAMYGDTALAMELLKLNPINDALAIPVGTSIKGYAKAA